MYKKNTEGYERYTLSLHWFSTGSEKNHLDIFFHDSHFSSLVHYSIPLEQFRAGSRRFKRGALHRKKYLEYSGPISGGRGRVRVLKKGKYMVTGKKRLRGSPFIKIVLPS